MNRHSAGFVAVTGIECGLTAAGLFRRDDHCSAVALEQVDRS
jgi:hypothetical protein